jgi:putative NADPH-quinone reductase
MKNILVIDGHPDTKRAFCHAAAEAYAEGARSTGYQTRLVRLADAEFQILRSAAEFAAAPTSKDMLKAREDVMWADHLVLVFPLWLGSAPAYVRAFLEQLSRAEFVAHMDGKTLVQRLKGKSARLIVTMGMPSLMYRLMFGAHGVKSIAQSVLGFAGVRPVRKTLIGLIDAEAKTQERRLARLRALGTRAA